MKKLKKNTIKLLRKIQQQIMAEPKRIDMHDFVEVFAPEVKINLQGTEGSPEGLPIPPCGTQACVAGWACLIGDPNLEKELKRVLVEDSITFVNERHLALEETIQDKAVKILGITEAQGVRLFFFKDWGNFEEDEFGYTLHDKNFEPIEAGWPEKFSKRYEKSKTAKGRAKATFDRIEHFIATNGAE
jgi:hypothetical protein